MNNNGMNGYMVHLDSLRAIAVFSVIVTHFIPANSPVRPYFDWGGYGVQLFFVLSGFLITGILLKCRDIADSNKKTGLILRRFYIRRFLRLMPVYYLALAAATIIGFNLIRHFLAWHLLYASNFYVSYMNAWEGPGSHFWSLAVEEQFYLIWPMLIFFVPRNYLHKSICFAFFLGLLSRILCIALKLNTCWIATLPLTNLDSLAIGALLAFYIYNKKQDNERLRYLLNMGLWIGAPISTAFTITHFAYPNNLFDEVLFKTFLSLFFVWIIYHASQGFQVQLGNILKNNLILYIGKISYGIYVYHYFMIFFVPKIMAHMGLSFPTNILLQFIVLSLSTLLFATFPWFFIEKPLSKYKKYFLYSYSY